MGDEGAGHFVKMVHNGIEYGDMQLICEAYHLMKDVLGMRHEEMAQVSPGHCLPLGNHLSDEQELTSNPSSFLFAWLSGGPWTLPNVREAVVTTS